MSREDTTNGTAYPCCGWYGAHDPACPARRKAVYHHRPTNTALLLPPRTTIPHVRDHDSNRDDRPHRTFYENGDRTYAAQVLEPEAADLGDAF